MKIALINTLYPPYQVGGAERSVQVLAEGLLSHGLQPIVIALHPQRQENVEIINGVKVYRVPLANFYWPFRDHVARPPLPLRMAWHVRDLHNSSIARRVGRILRAENPNLVHTHNLTGMSVAVWSVAAKLGLPIVHTVRDYSLMCPRGMYRNGVNCDRLCPPCIVYAKWRRHMSRQVSAVVGVSNFILNRYVKMGFFSFARRTVIYNAVLSEPGCEHKGHEARLRIGYLGRLDPHKGLQDVLDVLRNSPELRENVELIVGGRGAREHEEKLRLQAANLRIHWLGFVPPKELLSQIDILIVPSRWHEPFARVIIEAYASGRPVIATRRGGIVEIVDEGRTGWLYDPDRPRELELIIKRLLLDRDLLSTMARNSLEKAQTFGIEHHARAYRQLYEDVINTNRG